MAEHATVNGHPLFRGWKWEMNYRGWDIYYSARKGQNMAWKSGCMRIVLPFTPDGAIFAAVDERISED
jgi:hypothetical protein